MGGVIELDLSRPWEPEPPPAPRWPPRLPAFVLPVVVAVATLLTVTAAAAPRRWDPVLSLREANTTLRFGPDDTAYVVTQRTRSGRLQAYPPGRARPRWTVNFPGGYPVPAFAADDPGLLVLPVFNADPAGQGAGNLVQGRDAHTGRLLWTRPGMELLGLGPHVAVLTNREQPGGRVRVAPGPGGAAVPSAVIEAVDPRTGQPRWTRTVPSDVVVGWDADAVIELAMDGRLRLSDVSTGEVRREVRTTLLGRPFHAYLDDGLVVVLQQFPGDDPSTAPISVAYDPGSGAERWREDTPLFSDCDDRYRCEAESGELTVTETASGVVRYRGLGDQYLVRGDRLVVTAAAAPTGPGTRVYDLRTGRLVRALPGWIYAGHGEEADLMIQPLAGSGLLVATLDAATGRVLVLGRTTDWTGGAHCVRGVRFVGCSGAPGLRIWRLAR